MAQFVFAIIFWIVAIALVITALAVEEKNAAYVAGAVAVAVLGFFLFAWGGIKSVPIKNIGVPVSFGAVSGNAYGPGAHWTWTPWLSLTDIDETIQTTTYEGSNCLQVRIGGQQTACANITIQWQIEPQAAPALLQDYANHGDLMTEITDAVVVRELKQVVNNVVGDYNPITDVSSVTNTPTATSQFTGFSSTILKNMQTDIGTRVKVINVLMPNMQYPDSIESKLQDIQQAYANFAIAQENVKVNQANSQAFAKLGTPTVPQLIAQCLTDVKSEANLPAGFSCFPGASSGLALPSK